MSTSRILGWQLFSTALASGVLIGVAPAAFANPSGGQVVGGSASISAAPGTTTIDQSSKKAIIDWQRFSIAPGETTRFNQPGSDAIALNRVRGTERSDLFGRLEGNGQVWLVNPNGVLIGPGAKIDVGGFLATTADIRDPDFFAGRYDFAIPSPQADVEVVNQGTISVRDSGLAALVAPHARNDGLIEGRYSQVVLAGAPTFAFDFYGDGLINFQLTSSVTQAGDPSRPLVDNAGTIRTEGGRVLMTAAAAGGVVDSVIDVSGVVEARTFAMRDGEIVLQGADHGIVAVAGTLDASGKDAGEHGGTVKVLGEKVALYDGAQVDVAGNAGGGTALVGGNFQGKGPERNAKRTYVGKNAKVAADAVSTGDGGKVIVWSDEVTGFAGEISARGGAQSGNGGFVEVSGKQSLGFTGTVDLAAPSGEDGSLLLDPDSIVIAEDDGQDGEITDGAVLFSDSVTPEYSLSASALEALDGDIRLQAADSISVDAALNLVNQGSGETFGLQAGGDIDINASIVTAGGNVHLEADSPYSGAADGIGIINLNAAVTTNGGNVTVIANNVAFSGPFVQAGGGAVNHTVPQNGAATDFIDISHIGTSGPVTIGQAATRGPAGDGIGAETLTVGSLTMSLLAAVPNTVAGNLNLVALNDIAIAEPLTVSQSLSMQSGNDIAINAAITTGGTNVALEADSPFLGEPDAIGSIAIDGSISTNGGNISAQANNAAGIGNGITIAEGTVLSTTGSGTITLEGTGGTEAGNVGVITLGTVQSEDGNISITGIGTGSAASFNNDGVSIFNGGIVEALGSGNVEINGTGGLGTNDNQGVAIGSASGETGSSIVRVFNGDLQITGSGNSSQPGGGTFGSHGIFIFDAGVIAATGAGSISLNGTGANGGSGILVSTFTGFDASDTISIGTGSGGGALELNSANGVVLDTPTGVPAIDMSTSSGDLILRADSDDNGTGSISAPHAATLVMGTGGLALSAAEGIFGVVAGEPLSTIGVTRLAANNTASGSISITNRDAESEPITTRIDTVAGTDFQGLTNLGGEIELDLGTFGTIEVAQRISSTNLVNLAAANINLQADIQGDVGVNLTADSITQTGGIIVTSATLLIQEGEGAGTQSFALTSNNRVATLAVQPRFDGIDSFDFVNGGDLRIEGRGVSAGMVNLLVAGRLTLDGSIVATGAGTPILVRASAFTNNVPGEAGLQPGAGRFLAYSIDPGQDNRGGLAGQKLYDSTFATTPPGSPLLPAGNVFLYQIAPEVQVTANNSAREYGDANPPLTFVVDPAGLIDGDTPQQAVVGSAATVGSDANVGSYPISLAVTSPLRYRLRLVDGTLAITPAPVTADVNDASRLVGEVNPPFTATFDPTDFKLGQGTDALGALVFATDANIASPPGSYQVLVIGFGNPNYVVASDSAPGTLTVGRGVVDVPPTVFNPTIPTFVDQPTRHTTTSESASVVAFAPAQAHLLPQVQRALDESTVDPLYSNDGNRDLWGLATFLSPVAPSPSAEMGDAR